MIYCPECGTANRDGSKFCNECGTSLAPREITCPSCGTVNPPLSKFCNECGSRLAAAPPPRPEAPAPPARPVEAPPPPLARPVEVPPPPPEPLPEAPVGEEVLAPPSWLAELRAAPPPPEELPPEAPAAVEEPGVPAWLTGLRAAPPPTPTAPVPEAPTAEEEFAVPEWLTSLRVPPPSAPAPTAPPVPPAPAPEAPVAEEEFAVPDWLTSLRVAPPSAPAPAAPPVPPAPAPEAPVAIEEPAAPAALPDWLFLEEEGLGEEELLPPIAPTAIIPEAAPAEELPDWVREMRPPEAPAFPPPVTAPPEVPMGATPEEELPGWVRALKPAELMGAPAEGAAPRPARERAGPAVLRDITGGLHEDAVPIVLPGGRTARKEAPPLPSADLAASFDAVVKTPPEVTEPAPPKRRRGLGGLVRRLMSGVLILVIAAPLLLSNGSAWVSARPRPTTQGFAETVNAVAAGDAVWVLVDYGPDSQDEMNPVAEAALYDLTARQARLVILGLTPEGSAIAQQVIQRVASAGYEYGQHYVIGYLAGEEAGLVRAAADLATTVPQDAVRQESLGSLAVTQGLQKAGDFRLVLVIGNDAARLERWIAQLWARTGGQPPIVVASSTAAGPLLRAYGDTRQVAGILEGLPGAAEYETAVLRRPARAARLLDPLLYAHLAVIGFVLLGNLAFAVTRLTEPAG